MCKNSIRILTQKFKKIDIFGNKVELNFKNEKLHKTYFGSCITLLVFILSVLAIIFFGQGLIFRDNPDMIVAEYLNNLPIK